MKRATVVSYALLSFVADSRELTLFSSEQGSDSSYCETYRLTFLPLSGPHDMSLKILRLVLGLRLTELGTNTQGG